MFRNLCGDDVMKNVVIVTNMWSRVEPEVGEAREAELMEEDKFFKPAIMRGTRMARHKNTDSSAEGIIRLLVNNSPLPLQVQRELVEEGKDIAETSAGQELNRELNEEIRKHKDDIRTLAEEMEQAAREKDEETRTELEIETRKMHEQMRRSEDQARRLESDYRREKREFTAHLAELERNRRETYRVVMNLRSTTQCRPTPVAQGQFANPPGRFGDNPFSRSLGSARTVYRSWRENLQ